MAYATAANRFGSAGFGVSPRAPRRAEDRLRKGKPGGASPRFGANLHKGRNVLHRAINRLKDFHAITGIPASTIRMRYSS